MARDIVPMGESLIARRTAAKEKMNPALQAKLQWIIDWKASENCQSLIKRWELGAQVTEIVKDLEEDQGRKYGLGSMKLLETVLYEDRSVLNDARRFYRVYPDKKRVEEICQMTMQDGDTHVSFSHIRQLLSTKDESTRQEALNLALINCWTSEQLGAHVQKVNGGKMSNSPNGRAGIPKDAQTVIAQQISFADDFDSRNARVWDDPKHSISHHVDKLDETAYTEDLAKKLGEVAQRMQQLANAAQKRADEATAAYNKVWRALKMGTDNAKMAASLIKALPMDDDDGEEHLPTNPRATRTVGRRQKASA